VKYRVCLIMLSAALLSSLGFAQVSSRFDLTGNASFGNLQFVGAPSGSQVRALGWQTSGISHFNHWLGMSSQFSGGYASADAIQLIGYTGPGKVYHYASLVGPRIIFASRSRLNSYIEGLGGIDFARTKFTSNGAIVTGQELQSAYSVGGGAQINVSRRVGLNVEAHYFDTQHSVATLGWTPAHLQIAAGLVFRFSNLRDRIIVDKQPAPVPSPTIDTQTASGESGVVTSTSSTEPAVVTAPAPAPVAMVITPPTSVEVPRPQPAVQEAKESQIVRQQPVVAAVVVSQPAPALATVVAPAPVVTRPPTPVATPAPTPKVAQFQPSVVSPTAVLNQTRAAQVPAQAQAPQPQPAPISRPAVSSNSAPAVSSYATTPAPYAQAQPQQQQAAAPLSLGEYARRLREKKQHHEQ